MTLYLTHIEILSGAHVYYDKTSQSPSAVYRFLPWALGDCVFIVLLDGALIQFQYFYTVVTSIHIQIGIFNIKRIEIFLLRVNISPGSMCKLIIYGDI